MQDKLKYLLQSRKFWAVILAVALVLGRAYAPDFPLTQAQVSNLIYVLIAYILGTAIEDQGRGKIETPTDSTDPSTSTLPTPEGETQSGS